MEQNLLSRGRGSRQTLLPRWVCPPSTNFLVRMLKRRKLSYLGSNKDTPPKQRPSLLNPVVEKKGGVPTCDAAWCLPHSGIRRGPTVNCRKSASLALSAFSAPGQAAEDAARQIVQEAAEAAEAMRREAAEWREKHRQASDRQIQAEAKAGIAAREADKLRRLLQREIGDGADLAKVMEEGSNWRGRAQQIVLLKHRLQEAQAGEAAPATVARPREDGNRRALDELKEKRRQEADKAEAELAEARGELEKLRFKCDAAVSRKKLLEDEVKNLKEKIAVLLSKTTNDDKLIAALRSQLEQSKRAPHETNPRVKAKPGNTTDGKGADVLKEELMRKEEQIERQLMIIHTLEAQIGDR
mmetsp:Transcript_30747/g.73214  ORF Transcript_30747/g.73214 Transcript_30747/m.73214 type:complete len:355 (+) Transcript_30747:107-1171(+)